MSFLDEFKALSEKPKEESTNSYFAEREMLLEYVKQCRKGNFKIGLSTGSAILDKYFRFKQGKLLIINGHDNVGKSILIWYLAMLSSMLHDWKWIIFSSENDEGEVFEQLQEFYLGVKLKNATESQFERSFDFVFSHFKIVKIDKSYTAYEIIEIAQKEHKIEPKNGILIDPYNSLEMDYTKLAKGENQHNYDYKVAGKFRIFAKTNNILTIVNMHAATEALRKVYRDNDEFLDYKGQRHNLKGMPMPPNKSDTEGGGKFSNRADDFGTIHRFTQHPDLRYQTHYHQRKVKQTKTGGMPTPIDEPICFELMAGGVGFLINGFDVIGDIKKKKVDNKMSFTEKKEEYIDPIRNMRGNIETAFIDDRLDFLDNEEEIAPF